MNYHKEAQGGGVIYTTGKGKLHVLILSGRVLYKRHRKKFSIRNFIYPKVYQDTSRA